MKTMTESVEQARVAARVASTAGISFAASQKAIAQAIEAEAAQAREQLLANDLDTCETADEFPANRAGRRAAARAGRKRNGYTR